MHCAPDLAAAIPYARTMAYRRKQMWSTGLFRRTAVCFLLLPGLAMVRAQTGMDRGTADRQEPGGLSGTVTDRGGPLDQAAVTLTSASGKRDTLTASDGSFHFAGISPGTFQLIVSAVGHGRQVMTGTVSAGQVLTMAPITLLLSAAATDVQVHASEHDVAEAEMRLEEKQRVFGIVPNFHTSYIWDAAPLTASQKFRLSGREVIDPAGFFFTGVAAGVQQANNDFKGYGQGAAGYGRRYGAAYGDLLIGNFLTDAIFPSIFHQDPRYFYKGTGSTGSRAWYAISRSVVARNDKGRWQPDYSSVLGSLAAGGLSNLYYPSTDRNGVGLTFGNAALGIGGRAAGNLMREFVLRHITPHVTGKGEGK